MKKLLLITISLSIAYWGVLLAVEYSWTLPIPFLIIAYIWYIFNPNRAKYEMVQFDNQYGIKRTWDNSMLSMSSNNYWWFDDSSKSIYCYTTDKEKVERLLEQLNSN